MCPSWLRSSLVCHLFQVKNNSDPCSHKLSFNFQHCLFFYWHIRGSVKLCMLFGVLLVLVKHISPFKQLLYFPMCWAVAWTWCDWQLYSVILTAAQQEAESLSGLLTSLCLKLRNREPGLLPVCLFDGLFLSSGVKTDCPIRRILKCSSVWNSKQSATFWKQQWSFCCL